MVQITRKVYSLCSDFNPDEGYGALYDILSKSTDCDCYIEYTAFTKETLVASGYGEDLVANRLIDLGADDNEIVFIHIDY
jgi:hypothetical protein